MDISTWSIRKPIPAILVFVLLSVAGLLGFRALPIADMPDLQLPTIHIELNQPGAAPAQLEAEVVRKVEDGVASLSGIRNLSSAITEGQVRITVRFELEKDLSDALNETRNAVEALRSSLPADLRAPSISADTVSSDPILAYAAQAPGLSEEALSWYVDDAVAKAIGAVHGIGRFERIGGVQREVRVELDPQRLAGLQATVTDVSYALRGMQQDSSGGRLQLSGLEQSVRTIGTVAEARELAALPVVLPDGRRLRLDEVAQVRDDVAEPTQAARLDGQTAVGFRIYRAKGADETRVARDVDAALARLAADAPVTFTRIASSVTYTQEQFAGSMQMLWEGALLAVIVVWVFLRDWRATLVAASALPLSILPTFAVMHWLGYSLNTLTLLALAAVVGILVDDAIVEIENIERHARMGKPPYQAAADAVREIALAVIATTATIAVVFAPTAMMQGVAGQFFKQFGWTAVVAVLSSLLVARLLTLVMAAWFLRPAGRAERADGRAMTLYLRAVRWTLARRRLTLVLAVIVFIVSAAPVMLLRTGLVPASDRGFAIVDVELPPGASLAMTLERAEAARRALQRLDGVAHVLVTAGVGGDGNSAGELHRGSLWIDLVAREQRRSQAEIEASMRDALREVAGARFTVAGGMGAKMTLILASEDDAALRHAARELVSQLRGVGTLADITSTASLERPEWVVRPDFARAAELGVSTDVLGQTIRIATAGDFDERLGRLNLDTRQIYIRARLEQAARDDPQSLSGLYVRGREGLQPLGSMASWSMQSGPSKIDRYDRQRYVTVSAELNGMALGDALAATRQLPAVTSMPASVSLIDTDDAEILGELLSGFSFAIAAGLLCIYCVLVLLFGNVFLPLTILSAIPLSAGGAFVSLWLADAELSVPSMIGLVMLMGIATKNSILLVEYAIVGMREQGWSAVEAMVDACHKRARPIIMTSVAMIAGMLPIALGLGADASFRQPMAIAVIGGLLTSTALSLLIVPVIFVAAKRKRTG